jgi:triosephosphate isomerase
MSRLPKIAPPFFELGPKNYMYGKDVIDLAKVADKAAKKYDIRAIYSAPFVNAFQIVNAVKNIYVFAPYMDDVEIGRGVGKIMPESLKEAGISGVCLNHSEKPITLATLCSLVKRAEKIGLYTDVCASSMMEIKAVATLLPNIIIAEPVELIGSGESADYGYIKTSIEAVEAVSKEISVLIGAGISSGEDVYKCIYAGADATGCSSGIFKSQNPEAKIYEMFEAVRHAYDDRKNGEKVN